jgi:hypothetical protein
MSVFFNGRLLISPTTASQIDDSGMANRNLTVGNNVAYIGSSGGGQPNTELRFGSPSEARAVLKSGPLLEAIERAFDPSPNTGAPAVVIGIRVNPATQSSLMLEGDSGADDVIELKSEDYGLHTANIKVKVESGTNAGKKLTTQVGEDYYTQDDVSRNAFSVEYTGGEATATINVSNSQITLEAPLNTTVATIDLSVYDTIQKVVDRINAVEDFTADVLDGNGDLASLNALDSFTDEDVKTDPFTVTADLQACVDWFNSAAEGYVTATRQAGAGAEPDNIDWTYLAGGSNGTITNTEWSNAFDTLQNVDAQHVCPLSSDAAIHAMADAHVSFMSLVAKRERRTYVGGATGQTIAQVKAAAKALNSDRTAQCYPGHYHFNSAGKLTLYPSYMTAALIAAGFAGVNPGTALTNKALKVRGLETRLRNPTDTDGLIEAGVCCVEETEQGYKVVKSVSTWLTNDNYNRVEISTGIAADFVTRNLRDALDDLRGAKAGPGIISEALSRADTRLRELEKPEPIGPGVLVGDDENPAFRGLTVSLEGDVIRAQVQVNLVVPVNYILIVVHAQTYSGSAAV